MRPLRSLYRSDDQTAAAGSEDKLRPDWSIHTKLSCRLKRWLAGQRFISFCTRNTGAERFFRNTIHTPPTSPIIPLAAFDTGTSSGVVLEMKADGVSSVELTGSMDGRAPPKGSPSGYYDPGRAGRCASGTKTHGRRRKCCTSLRRKQAGNRQSLPDRSGTGGGQKIAGRMCGACHTLNYQKAGPHILRSLFFDNARFVRGHDEVRLPVGRHSGTA